jgi:hypothetical protein
VASVTCLCGCGEQTPKRQKYVNQTHCNRVVMRKYRKTHRPWGRKESGPMTRAEALRLLGRAA